MVRLRRALPVPQSLDTVFPRQGQFARDAAVLAANPPADVSVERIEDLLRHPMLEGSSPGRAAS